LTPEELASVTLEHLRLHPRQGGWA